MLGRAGRSRRKAKAEITESTRVSKRLVADAADQGLLVAVDEHVLGEGLLRREALVTCWTDMRLVCGPVLAKM